MIKLVYRFRIDGHCSAGGWLELALNTIGCRKVERRRPDYVRNVGREGSPCTHLDKAQQHSSNCNREYLELMKNRLAE